MSYVLVNPNQQSQNHGDTLEFFVGQEVVQLLKYYIIIADFLLTDET